MDFGDGTFNGKLDFMTGEVTGTFTPTGQSAENIVGARR